MIGLCPGARRRVLGVLEFAPSRKARRRPRHILLGCAGIPEEIAARKHRDAIQQQSEKTGPSALHAQANSTERLMSGLPS
jgi:hypothetical protein